MIGRVEGGENRAGGFYRADEEKLEGRIGLAGAQSAVNHDGGSMVPAEEVDGDPRDARLRGTADRANSIGVPRSRGTGRTPLPGRDPSGSRTRHS